MQNKKNSPFTEWILVISILGVFALIAIPRLTEGATIARINACKTNVMILNLQMKLYYQNEGKWPDNLKTITNNPNYFPDGMPKCPFGHEYTRHSSKRWVNQHRH